MTREQLESLVWRETHADFKGVENGAKANSPPVRVRYVLHLVEGVGTCSVPLSSLTLGELVDKLPSKYRHQYGFVLWRLVVGPGNIVLGVFGSALYDEQQACRAKVIHQTGVVPRLMLWVGSRPKVGETLDLESESIGTSGDE